MQRIRVVFKSFLLWILSPTDRPTDRPAAASCLLDATEKEEEDPQERFLIEATKPRMFNNNNKFNDYCYYCYYYCAKYESLIEEEEEDCTSSSRRRRPWRTAHHCAQL